MAAWLFIGIFPLIVKIFFFDFIPSAEWQKQSDGFGVVAGVLTAVGFSWWTLKNIANFPGGDFKKACSVLMSPLFGYVFGRTAVVMFVPMLLGIVIGHQMELPYTVANYHGSGSKGCRSPLVLNALPFLFDRICRVPANLRDSVVPGDEIMVLGRGTSFGLFPHTFHKLPNSAK